MADEAMQSGNVHSSSKTDEWNGVVDFCTLGMFIIDDIYPSPSAPDQTPHLSIPGGGGTYSAIGARLLSPPPLSKSIAWIIDAGTDFPSALHSTITSWQTNVLMRPRAAPTTRGWNGYGAHEHRSFKYLTEKKRLSAEDLTPAFLGSRSFHFISSPLRCVDMAQSILLRRCQSTACPPEKCLIVWEPVPDLCLPSELENLKHALQFVDVLSPNHEEMDAFFSSPGPKRAAHSDNDESDHGVDRSLIEQQASTLLASGVGPTGQGAIIVRAGKEGCYIATRTLQRWLPAYHQDASAVVDPTGGGNGFLGGFAVGMVRTGGDLVEAARWGSVAASFCIEQVGVPVLTKTTSTGEKRGGPERWNGRLVLQRLHEFREQTAMTTTTMKG